MSYLNLYHEDKLQLISEELKEYLNPCYLCPRECGARRLEGERGECGAGEEAEISGYGPHFGEEPPLVGRQGSGTIFFAFCNLRCVFCQNHPTSRGKEKNEVSTNQLAHIMLELQEKGCANINLVTPTHYVPQIVNALQEACSLGLQIPLVYNCSGYEKVEIIHKLERIIDIYMPDIKYANADIARKYSRISDYPRVAKAVIKEMYRQVGDLILDQKNLAVRGLLIRHLVMPGGLAGTRELMEFIARKVSPTSWINIMNQYYPAYLAYRYPEINRGVTPQEYEEAVAAAKKASSRFHLL